MKKIFVILALLSTTTFNNAFADSCDEVCLTKTLDSFLTALEARDPTKAPLAANIKATENAQWVAPGDGLWGTIGALREYRHVMFDESTGEVAVFQAITENGFEALLSVRLKVKNEQITESEMLVVRTQDMGNFLNASPPPLTTTFDAPVKLGDILSREKLIEITNGYFDAIEQNDSSVGSFDPKCTRTENGMVTSGAPMPENPEENPMAMMGAMNCGEQMNSPAMSYITAVQPRRYTLIDQERGLVLAMVMFVHNGRVEKLPEPGSPEAKMMAGPLRPFNVHVIELFKVVDGKVIEVEALMTQMPYLTPDPWVVMAASK